MTHYRTTLSRLSMVAIMFSLCASAWAASGPNLAPYTPVNAGINQGWSGPIVISTQPNSNLDSSATPQYSTADTLFIDYAFINNGDQPVNTTFSVKVYLDSNQTPIDTRFFPALGVFNPANSTPVIKVEDIQIPTNLIPLARGPHTIKVVLDADSGVSETFTSPQVQDGEADNVFQKSFNVEYPVPVITSATTATGQAGTQFQYQIISSNSPQPVTYGISGNAPAWMQVNPNTGLVYGTPPIDFVQTFTINVYATNLDNTGSLSVTVTITPYPPTITSPLSIIGYIGQPLTYTTTYYGSPSQIVNDNMPWAGLTGTNGTITGTPTQAGTQFVHITVSNAAGTDRKTLRIDILGPPIFQGPLATSGTVGTAFDFQLSAKFNPYLWIANGLPPGLQINSDTGRITGTPTTPGTYTVQLFATNAAGSGTSTMTIGIRNGVKPAIVSPLLTHGYVPAPAAVIPVNGVNPDLRFYYGIQTSPTKAELQQIGATVPPLTTILNNGQPKALYTEVDYVYSYSGGLPPGVTPILNTHCDPYGGPAYSVFTGEFDGVPAATGVYIVTVSATYYDANGQPQSVSQDVTWIIEGPIPHLNQQNLKLGVSLESGQTVSIGVTSQNDPNIYGLPLPNNTPFPGIASSPLTLTLPGTLSGTGGAIGLYWNRVNAQNANGDSLLIDPWPYVPVAVNEPTIQDDPATTTINEFLAPPIVGKQTLTFVVGVTQSQASNTGGGKVLSATLQTDAVSARNFGQPNGPNDGLVGLPNPSFGMSMTATELPLGVLGLGMDQGGVIQGTPTQAGVFFVKVQAQTTNTQTGTTRIGFGIVTLRILHIKEGQPIVTSPRAVVGETTKPFAYSFTYDNTAGGASSILLNPLALAPYGLSDTGNGVAGTVPANMADQPVTGIFLISNAIGTANNFNHSAPSAAAPGGHDTSTNDLIYVTFVFSDKSSIKPALASNPRVTASEMVPFSYKIVATQNATSITAVDGINGTPQYFRNLTLSATNNSQATISGIPEPGTSEFYPGEIMKPRLNSILLKMDNGTNVGWAVLDVYTTPAPPNIQPTIDTGPTFGFATVRNMSLSNIATAGLEISHPFYTAPTYEMHNGRLIGAGNTTRTGPPQQEFDVDTYWDRYVLAPYEANYSLFYGADNLPDGTSLDYSTGLIQGILNQVKQYNVVAQTFNAYGADTRLIVVRGQNIVITSPLYATAIVGQDFQYQITATGNPNVFDVLNLPPGLNIDKKTGLISGKPLVVSDPANPSNPQVAFELQLVASNAVTTGTGDVCLKISQVDNSPIINPPLTATGTDGQNFTYQISASSTGPGGVTIPITNYSAFLVGTDPAKNTLPLGLQFDNIRFSGPGVAIAAISQTGNLVTVTTTTNHGFAPNQKVNIDLSPDDLSFEGDFVISTVPTANTFTYVQTTSATKTGTVNAGSVATPLNPNFGTIFGTPNGFGNFDIVITASNVYGLGGAILHLQIAPAPAVITSQLLKTGIIGQPFTYTITATGSNAISYAVTSGTLPPGITLSGNTFNGTPTGTFNTYTFTVTATNPAGSTQANLTFDILEKPKITSPLTATVVVGQTFNYALTASGSPQQLVFTASPIPPGLNFTGTAITGVPTQPGIYNISMTATNVTGPLYTEESRVTLVLTVTAMQITSTPLLITGVVGTPITPYQIAATGGPTSFSASGLPLGLGIDPSTGIISGTPLLAGTTPVTITATNGVGTASAVINVAISSAPNVPAITSPLTATGVVNSLVPFNYFITATNNPTSFNVVVIDPATGLASTTTTLLSLGLQFDSNTGQINGTPTTAGTFELQLTATNASGSGTAILVLGISSSPGSPAITSPLTATALAGSPFTYQTLASNNPTTYSATVNGGTINGVALNPNPIGSLGIIGLSIDTTTGLITGAPVGDTVNTVVYNINLSASNGVGQPGVATLILTVLPPQKPVITSSLSATGIVGVPFLYVITANGFPTSYAATGLPPGLSIDTKTGAISGTPLLAGSYPVSISAANLYGFDQQTLTIVVGIQPGAPIITSATTAFASTGVPFLYTITASNNPTSFNAVGLPQGFAINTATGAITAASPSATGTFNIIILAINGVGTGSAQLTLTVASPLPILTSSTTVTGNVGVPFTYQFQATGIQPITYSITALPPGLTLSGDTISGTPTTAGTTDAQVTLQNAAGTTVVNFSINIGPALPPTITSPLSLLAMVNVPVNFTITATGSQPITFSVTGLPPGMIATGAAISGAPTTAGSYTVTITASNPYGSTPDVKTLLVTVLPLLPNVDTDGDGFPDELEIALGSNPLDALSTPFSGQFANPEPFHLPQPKLAIKLDFVKPNVDQITMSGSLPVPAGFTSPGQDMIVNVGGVVVVGSLNLKGSYISPDKKTSLKVGATKAKASSQNARYTIKLKGQFKTQLADEGLTNSAAVKQPVNIGVSILFRPAFLTFDKDVTVLYTNKNSKGSAK